MAVYIRNRSYHQTVKKDTHYHMMNGNKPDMHRIKKFGSIAYVHKPIVPSGKKLDDNFRLGFLIGYLEDQTGYEVYYPPEHVVQHVEHALINEDIVYKDRYGDHYTTSVANWIFNIEGAEFNNSNEVEDNVNLSENYEELEEKPT
ncbi:Integrase [Phytophthora palmivora]|uniref:Integrase n=1 Tax=Phytophthora palmivora TaxID=4796 RepID=A0A2P4WZW4_9STRA|nr:Integrase [Phytophthora palmivora]